MRRICLQIEYDGTDFAGWQRQSNSPSIQEEIEKNLYKITGEIITVHGSGRTDSGVHALAQIAHFDTESRMPAEKFTIALNCGLPGSIRIHKSYEVSEGFHSRFSAKRKYYRYTIENCSIATAVNRLYQYHVHVPLQIEPMQQAAEMFRGTHNFASFTTIKCPLERTIRTIYQSYIEKHDQQITFHIEGSGFLYNMVRIMIGLIIDVGKNRATLDDIRFALENPDKKRYVAATAPAHGLTLMEVFY